MSRSVSPKRRGATRILTNRQRAQVGIALVMLCPAVVLYTLFVVYPVISSVEISFTLWDGFSPDKTYVGLQNYRLVFGDSVFWGALKNNALLMVVPGAITLALALYFASCIIHGIRGANVFRVTFFFPNVISFVCIAVMWSFIYHPDVGVLNYLLRAVGLGSLARPWLASDTLIPATFAPMVWSSVGFFMVLYVAGMQQIPEELFDASKVDGASGWQTFWNVTWPMVWPINRMAVVFLVMGGLKAFDFIWVFAYGRPTLANQTMATWMYQKSFMENDFGYGTALALVLFLLVFVASIVTWRLLSKREVD